MHPKFRLFIAGKSTTITDFLQLKAEENWIVQLQQFIASWIDDTPAIETKTSGSTGKPKLISIPKVKMEESAKMTGSYFNLKEETTALLCMSAQFIAGKMMTARAMTLGWHLYVEEPSSHALHTRKYDFSAMVPLQVMAQVDQLHLVKTLIIGGAPLDATSLHTLLQTKHKGLYQTFGMTETTSHIALKNINEDHYTTLPGIEISVNQEGCLVIHAPMLLKNDLSTHDMVQMKNARQFIWKGRHDHVINSGGIKIHPEEVEKQYDQIITQPFFLYGVTDKKLGKKMVLFIEGEEIQDLEHQIKKKITYQFWSPKEIVYLSDFIRTETLKIKRKATVEAYYR